MRPPGRLRRLAALVPSHLRTAWWGLAAPRLHETGSLVVVQAVVRSPRGVLLALRRDLWGWELPGGHPAPGESPESALRREVREETGVEVAVERLVGEYVRTGFRPHTARVYLCRAVAGAPRASAEVVRSAWFDPSSPPETLLPWYRAPLEDALAARTEPFIRHERQGVARVLAGLWIDLRMRLRE